jgi:pyruvate dehydrogenase E1 component beta subunit
MHTLIDKVPKEPYYLDLRKAKVIRIGTDITLIGISYMTLECIEAAKVLATFGIDAEVIDLISINPIDRETLVESVKKTGRLIVADHAEKSCGVSAEVITTICEECFSSLRSEPVRITLPNHPAPTGYSLAEEYYPTSSSIVRSALEVMGKDALLADALSKLPPRIKHDQPYEGFTGPF